MAFTHVPALIVLDREAKASLSSLSVSGVEIQC